jgi:hypothetical protein
LRSRESESRKGRAFGPREARGENRFFTGFPAGTERHLSRRGLWRRLCRLCGSILLCAMTASAARAIPRDEPTVEQLKAEVTSAKVGDKAKICVQIAQKQLNESDRLYAASDYEKAQAALMDVVTYVELARDYAIESHKYQKQTEIAVRGMTRKLTEVLHSLGQVDQPPVEDALNRLERVRDDLQSAMFKKGVQ